MASDSEGNRRKKTGAQARPEPPVIDLAANEVAAETPAESEAASPAERPAEEAGGATDEAAPAAPEESAALAGESAAGGEVTADGAPSDRRPEGGKAEAGRAGVDDSALLSEVPPSGETGGGAREAGGDRGAGGTGRLLASAVFGAALALGGAGGVLYALGWLPPQAAPATSPTEGVAVDLSSLQSRIDELTTRLDQQAGQPPADGALADRLAALESEVKALPAAGASAAATDKLAADLAALSERVDGLAAAAVDPAALSGLQAAVSDLKGRLTANETAVAALAAAREAADGGLKTLAGRVEAVEGRLDAGPKGGEIAALSLAAVGLSAKVAAGLPFVTELDLAAAAAPDLAGLDRLRPLAATGVPTFDALAAALPVEAMLSRRPMEVSKGWAAGLLESARSLVNYRETVADSGDPASRAIAGIRAALVAGDTAGAIAAGDGLPDWARAGAGDWFARLDERAAADQAVAALTERIVTRLEASAGGS